MSIVKKEARLSGILLARKGSAEPAYTDHRLTKQLNDSMVRADNDMKPSYNDDHNQNGETSLSSLEDIIREVQRVSERQHNGRIHSDNLKEISETVEKSIGSITKTIKPAEKTNTSK
jgi:hypothetical protein